MLLQINKLIKKTKTDLAKGKIINLEEVSFVFVCFGDKKKAIRIFAKVERLISFISLSFNRSPQWP